jgi:hypothetical protein
LPMKAFHFALWGLLVAGATARDLSEAGDPIMSFALLEPERFSACPANSGLASSEACLIAGLWVGGTDANGGVVVNARQAPCGCSLSSTGLVHWNPRQACNSVDKTFRLVCRAVVSLSEEQVSFLPDLY